jgi:hypothetical protein
MLPLHLIILITLSEEYVMKFIIMQFSPTSSHFIPLWSKYSPQNRVLDLSL